MVRGGAVGLWASSIPAFHRQARTSRIIKNVAHPNFFMGTPFRSLPNVNRAGDGKQTLPRRERGSAMRWGEWLGMQGDAKYAVMAKWQQVVDAVGRDQKDHEPHDRFELPERPNMGRVPRLWDVVASLSLRSSRKRRIDRVGGITIDSRFFLWSSKKNVMLWHRCNLLWVVKKGVTGCKVLMCTHREKRWEGA